MLKNNNTIWKEIDIYLKKVEDNERLRTVDEILNTPASGAGKKKFERSGFGYLKWRNGCQAAG